MNMSNKSKSGSKIEFSDFDQRVGQAWSQHFRKQYDQAIEMFTKLIDEWPDHIDANYGLGLSLRMAGQKERATDQFTKTQQYLSAEMAKSTGDVARFQMLQRMAEQQLSALRR
jgi:tetratricopeptide (TPR) repeat protein